MLSAVTLLFTAIKQRCIHFGTIRSKTWSIPLLHLCNVCVKFEKDPSSTYVILQTLMCLKLLYSLVSLCSTASVPMPSVSKFVQFQIFSYKLCVQKYVLTRAHSILFKILSVCGSGPVPKPYTFPAAQLWNMLICSSVSEAKECFFASNYYFATDYIANTPMTNIKVTAKYYKMKTV